MNFLLAGITLGFLGSFHCIGMCGPIALALPLQKQFSSKKVFLILLYNLGRMSTYSVFGAVVGMFGQTVAIAGYQSALSIFLGTFILASLVVPQLFSATGKFGSWTYPLFQKLRTGLSKLLKRDAASSLYAVGVLNGALPCGFVYMALAGATATGSIFTAVLFMAAFGAGTIPVMLSLPLAGSFITLTARNTMRKTVPYVIGFTAVLLILRGLELGIPYVSPQALSNNGITCHDPSHHAQHNAITCTGQN